MPAIQARRSTTRVGTEVLAVDHLVDALPGGVMPGGRIVIVSSHSLSDAQLPVGLPAGCRHLAVTWPPPGRRLVAGWPPPGRHLAATLPPLVKALDELG
jgi:hypothetical protein